MPLKKWPDINNPTLGTFVNIEVENKWISISRDLVQKIVFHGMPKWNLVTQDQVVNSAKVRKLNLDNELEIQMNNFEQEKRAKETRDADVEWWDIIVPYTLLVIVTNIN